MKIIVIYLNNNVVPLERTLLFVIKFMQKLATNLDTEFCRKTVTTFHAKRINLSVTWRIKSIVNNIVISPRQAMARQFSPLGKNV